MLAAVQSLGSLYYALENTGCLLELQVECTYLEFGVLPTAIALTEYGALFKDLFSITFPVIPGPCAHST